MSITELSGLPLTQTHSVFEPRTVAPKPDIEASEPFGAILETALTKTNQGLLAAGEMAENFAAGRVDDIHGTMIALGQADVQLRLVGSMRNRVVDAFYELWRMQV